MESIGQTVFSRALFCSVIPISGDEREVRNPDFASDSPPLLLLALGGSFVHHIVWVWGTISRQRKCGSSVFSCRACEMGTPWGPWAPAVADWLLKFLHFSHFSSFLFFEKVLFPLLFFLFLGNDDRGFYFCFFLLDCSFPIGLRVCGGHDVEGGPSSCVSEEEEEGELRWACPGLC